MSTETTLEPTAPAQARPPHPVAPRPAPAPSVLKRLTARGNLWRPLLGILVGVGLLVWLGRIAVHAYYYEETDDAYVTGHLHLVSPRINGHVTKVFVHDNQEVKAGDPLAEIDPQEYEIAVSKAQAALAQTRAQSEQSHAALAQIDAQLAEARARVQQAQAQLAQTGAQLELARLTLNRFEQLFKTNGVVAQADLDNARSSFRAAEAADAANRANLAAAQSSVSSTEASAKSAQAQVAAAEASVDVAATALRDAQRMLDYTTLVAPATGRVCGKAVEVGNQILAGQTILDIAEPNPWVTANFKETQLARMHHGSAVELTIDALPGVTLHGTVESISPASGAQFALLPPDNATGNFNKVVQRVPVKIALDPASAEAVGSRLRFGLSAVVNVRVR